MDIHTVLSYLYALVVIGIMLFGLWYVARLTGRHRIAGSSSKRLITVLETAFLAQQMTVHVVKVGSRYLLVGGGAAGVSTLAELDEAEIGPWIEEQRRLLNDQTASIGEILKRLRGS